MVILEALARGFPVAEMSDCGIASTLKTIDANNVLGSDLLEIAQLGV